MCAASRSSLGPGGRPVPPSVAAQVKAIACELPDRLGLPLFRLSSADIQKEVVAQGVVPHISRTTVWRWLDAALRPWQHRTWIFPRDPDFAGKAERNLDLYQRCSEGEPLQENDFVISAEECLRERAWTYLAAWNVHRAKLFGRSEKKNGIAPTDGLMAEVMTQEPYQSAGRVFWIMDNRSNLAGPAEKFANTGLV